MLVCVCVCVQDVEFFMQLATLFLLVPSQTFRIKCQMLLRARKANDCNQKQLTTMLCIRTKVCTTAKGVVQAQKRKTVQQF